MHHESDPEGPWQWLSVWHSHYEKEGGINAHTMRGLIRCAQTLNPASHLSLSRSIWTSLTPRDEAGGLFHELERKYWYVSDTFITLYWLCELSPPHHSLPRIITEFCRVLSRMIGSRRLDEATSDHWWLRARDGAGPGMGTRYKGLTRTVISWLCLCRAGPEVRLLQCAADRDRKPHFWQQLNILRWHLDRA